MKKFTIPVIVLALCLALVATRSLTQDQPPAADPADAPQTPTPQFEAGDNEVAPTDDEQAPEPPIIEDVDLQALIDQAADGDTITIATGTYMIDEGLRIQGRSDLTIICQSPVNIFCTDPAANVLNISGSTGITFAGGRLRHDEPAEEELSCSGFVVVVNESSDVLVYRSELDGCGTTGVAMFHSRNVRIDQCHVHNNSSLAFYLFSADGVKITNCRIENNKSMLWIDAMDDLDEPLEMWGNTILNNPGPDDEPDEESAAQFEQLDEQIDVQQGTQ